MSSTQQQPDILIFMSDQHTARLMGCAGDPVVETPNLDALAAGGCRFEHAYTAYPLCVPARFAFMSGMRPFHSGVLGNGNIMPSEVATVAHCCGAVGYETVLCGRMHFSGQDQRHGFERRIMGDFTPTIAGRGGPRRADLGPYVGTPAGNWEKHYGGGEDSPVLAYDRAVVAAALEELARPHERPLLMVVGLYGPHHTFVAPTALYRKYLERVTDPLPVDGRDWLAGDRAGVAEREHLTPDQVRCFRAAYFGMIEQVDSHLGAVRAAWAAHQARSDRPAQFWYTSDHGEQGGNRGKWSKMDFYDDAAKIPLIVNGDGVEPGCCATPVSIIDIPTTVCALAGAPALPAGEGRSLLPALQGGALEVAPVFCDMLRGGVCGMVRRGRWKYWSVGGEGMLIDCENDPDEARNLVAEQPAVAAELDALWRDGIDFEALAAEQGRRRSHERVMNAWGEASATPEPDRWSIPETAWVLPTP